MAPYIFQDLAAKGRSQGIKQDSSRKSIEWFRDMAQGLNRVTPQRVLSDDSNKVIARVGARDVGSLLFYSYDPKGKDTLPFYDRFPIVFVSDLNQDGWSGLNMHYLPPYLRAKLMDALYRAAVDRDKPEKTTLAISYKLLNEVAKNARFRPCYKRYLADHVTSPIRKISPANWDMAIMLPLQRFVKASAQEVWEASTKAQTARRTLVKNRRKKLIS